LSAKDALDSLFSRYLSGSKIFANRDVLKHDYIPDNLPHRGEQIQRLGGILAPALSKSKISNAFIYGKTGTGKTAVTKFVLSKFEGKAREVGAPVDVCYVNCRLSGTNYRVLASICKSVGMDVPFTGLATGELLDRFKDFINLHNSIVIVALDEMDALVKDKGGDDLLYELTRINEGLREGWVALVGITNDVNFKEFLDPRVLSSLSEEEVVFKPYLANELSDILRERAEMAFLKGVVDEGTIRLCAALAAGEHGDARRALDLLRVAGELAERLGRDKVDEELVRLAQQKVEHDRMTEILKSLPIHSKLVLLSVFILNAKLDINGAITGDVYNVYSELCGKVSLEPLTQRRVSGLINELDVLGILNARVVSFGRYGRTKKIRLGIPERVIMEILSEDELVGKLFSFSPTSVKKK